MSELDPNIKYIVKFHIIKILASIHRATGNTPNNSFKQYINNLLNLCNTVDEIIYVIPNDILYRCFGKKYNIEMHEEPNVIFKDKYLTLKTKYPEEALNLKDLILKYHLTK